MSTTNYSPKTENLSDVVKRSVSDSPLVILLPHSGLEYYIVPHHLDLAREAVSNTLVTGIDHSVPEVTKVHEFEDVTVIWTDLARGVVDVNRGRSDYDYHSVHSGPIVPKSQGVIWNATIASNPDNIERMLTHPYSHKEFENLMGAGYDPLNLAVKEAMAKAREKYRTAVLFDVHSIWANETSTVQKGTHSGAYLVGEPLEPPSLGKDGAPHLYLMTSGEISCPPEFEQYVIQHFQEYGLRVKKRDVAFPMFELAHRKYADRESGYVVFSMEIIGHHGLEKDRAKGKLLFDLDDQGYLKLLQQAFNDLFIGLRDLRFKEYLEH